MTIERVNVKTATVEKALETIGHGTGTGEIEVAEATGKTEECQGAMRGVMIMTARREGTETFSRVA